MICVHYYCRHACGQNDLCNCVSEGRGVREEGKERITQGGREESRKVSTRKRKRGKERSKREREREE